MESEEEKCDSGYAQNEIVPEPGAGFIANMGDRQRSEGAIFETPRDHRDKAGSKINSSLFNIAGALNINKAMATMAIQKKAAINGNFGGGTLSPTGCQSMHEILGLNSSNVFRSQIYESENQK